MLKWLHSFDESSSQKFQQSSIISASMYLKKKNLNSTHSRNIAVTHCFRCSFILLLVEPSKMQQWMIQRFEIVFGLPVCLCVLHEEITLG